MEIKVENLYINYGDNEAVKDVTFDIKAGEIVTVIGPNGSGKSTLLKAVSRCLKPAAGNVLIGSRNIDKINTRELARSLSVLPQVKNISADITVEELVSYGRYPHLKFGGRLSKEDKEIVGWALEKTGLHEMRRRDVITLSGGERQRAWIAMSLAQKAQILLLDEPTTYLDISYQLEVLELIKELNETLGITVMMVLHDLNQASRYSDKILVMNRGGLYGFGTPEKVIISSVLNHVFKIEADIYTDEINNCPYFIPKRTTAYITECF